MSNADLFAQPELIYVSGTSRVCAIDAETGAVVWEARLPIGFFGPQFTTLLVEGDALYVSNRQRLVRLDRWTGAIVWESRKVNGFLGAMATANSGTIAQQVLGMRVRAAAAASAASG